MSAAALVFKISLLPGVLAVALLCVLLVEANDRYRQTLRLWTAEAEDVVSQSLAWRREAGSRESIPQGPEPAGLRLELARAEQELENLTAAYTEARGRAEPDFQRLKGEALAELKRWRQQRESRGPTFSLSPRTRYGPGPGPVDPAEVATVFADTILRQYGPSLDTIGVDEAARQNIHEAFQERARINAELGQQLRRGEIGPQEMRRQMRLGDDADLIASLLSDEQAVAFKQAEEERLEQARRISFARIVAIDSGPMSADAQALLTQGYTAMMESGGAYGGFSSGRRGPEKRLEDLSKLRQWMSTQVSTEDMSGVDLFIELQSLRSEEFLERSVDSGSTSLSVRRGPP